MELGLFWLLEERPLQAQEVAAELGIAPIPCQYWLQLLSDLDLVEQGPRGFEVTSAARTGILDVLSQSSWALLAEEAREKLQGLRDLPADLRDSARARKAPETARPSYVAKMAEDPERARRFTRMLLELHQPLAEGLVEFLDLTGVDRLMDLGGGSGVVSLAFLRRYPRLTATVVDVANVCAAGREIATEAALEDRITYHAADFLRDSLPSGFDLVLECDVNIYSVSLFEKIRDSLSTGGRFVIVDQLAPAEGVAPRPRVHWAFAGSLVNSEFMYPTAGRIREQLERAGFRIASESRLPSAARPCARFTEGMYVLEARK
jgi:SAM-dependent methyltransferase